MSSSEAVRELMEVAAKVLLQLCRLFKAPLTSLMKDRDRFFEGEK